VVSMPVCLYSQPWYRIISFRRRGLVARLEDTLVGCIGGVCKSSIKGIKSINAPYVGEDAHPVFSCGCSLVQRSVTRGGGKGRIEADVWIYPQINQRPAIFKELWERNTGLNERNEDVDIIVVAWHC
jgi:hypothetical protein